MHLHLINYGSPEKHRKFEEELNLWRYEVEGPLRRGHIAPFISEVKFYDVRIPEEIAPMFLRDLNTNTLTSRKYDVQAIAKTMKGTWMTTLVKIFRFFTPWKDVKKLPGSQAFKLTPWYYSFLLGGLKDPMHISYMNDEKREVL